MKVWKVVDGNLNKYDKVLSHRKQFKNQINIFWNVQITIGQKQAKDSGPQLSQIKHWVLGSLDIFLSRCWWWFNNKYSFHCYTDHSSSFSSQDYQFWSRVVLMISEEHQQYNDGLNVTIFPWDGSVQRCHHTMVSWSSGKLRWNSSNIIQILTINNKALKYAWLEVLYA